MRSEQFVAQLQSYTMLLVSVKSRLWKNAARDNDDDAHSLTADFPALLHIEPKRWQGWNAAKREQAVMKQLTTMENPYHKLHAAPKLFLTAQTRFGLSDEELRILLFLVTTRTRYPLASVFADYWDSKQLLLLQDISHLFDMTLARVTTLLSRTGQLRKSGLIINPRFYSDMLEPMDSLVTACLEKPDQSIDVLLQSLYHRTRKSEYAIEDFQHVSQHINAILKIFSTNTTGANVLIYGPPGTGKTELAKAINKRLDRVLYRLNPLTQDADDSRPLHRVDAFYQLQTVVKQQEKAAILFDEVEEIFTSSDSSHKSPLKSFLNDLLETNTAPTLWVCNSVENFDHAFIRRFDYVLHLDYPNYAAKRAYLKKQDLSAWLSRNLLDRVAQHAELGFGQLAPAISLIKKMAPGEYRQNDSQFLAMINEYLRAVGKTLLSEATGQTLERHHMPNLYNSSVPIERVMDIVKHCGFGRFLFHGEQGTGKSTAANYIAENCKLERKTITETELMTICDMYGLMGVDILFSDLDPATDLLVLEDFNQCLQAKPWQAGSLVDAVSGHLKHYLSRYQGFVIVITEGQTAKETNLFDLAIAFKALHPKQLDALEAYRNGEVDTLDQLGTLGFGQTVVDIESAERNLQTTTTLADFHKELRETKIRDALTGQDANKPKRTRERLSIVPNLTTPEPQ